MSTPKKPPVIAKMQDMTSNTFSHPMIESAFAERPDLKQRIYNAIPKSIRTEDLFIDIAEFIIENQKRGHANEDVQNPSKKRKLNASQGTAAAAEQIMFETWKSDSWGALPDISFSIPQRKKLNLEIGYSSAQGLRARNASTDEIECAIRWNDIQHIICLPVPEKAQAQYMFCVIPYNRDGVNVPPTHEQIMWTVPNTLLKPSQVSGKLSVEGEEETYRSLLLRILNKCLQPFQKQVVVPNEKEFMSQAAQVYRKGERAVHVKAFRGSKDGFLFLLPLGLFFGFKKPLLFIPFDTIDSISYTSVLQRTFNLNLTLTLNTANTTTNNTTKHETQDLEFSMLDQSDFNGIDAFVKRHRLQDASMAEQRRAKKYNINGSSVKGGNGGEGGHTEHEGADGGMSGEGGELEKARREMEDAEDAEEEEEDENFDPGSEGESEGSGSDSQEDDEEGKGGMKRHGDEGSSDDDDDDEDLVRRELGSEAEDVESGSE